MEEAKQTVRIQTEREAVSKRRETKERLESYLEKAAAGLKS